MVYKFKVLSDEDDKFYMDIEILSSQTFYDLHDLIQEELEFDRSHLASFFVASHSWQRTKEIPLMNRKGKKATKLETMDNAVLGKYVKDAHQKFIYIFDYVNDRGFFIELIETKPEAPGMYYPVCTDFGGDIPSQIGKKTTKKIFDDEDEDAGLLSSRKTVPQLDEFLDDIPEPLDKETEESIKLSMEEEPIDENSIYKEEEEDIDKMENDLEDEGFDLDNVDDIPEDDE